MIDKLKAQIEQLSLQRYQAKDVIEGCEKALSTLTAMVQVLEQQAKEFEEANQEPVESSE